MYILRHISYLVLSGGVPLWQLQNQWLVVPKSNTSPPACCSAEAAALRILFPIIAALIPVVVEVSPTWHLLDPLNRSIPHYHENEYSFWLGDLSENESAMIVLCNLCSSTLFFVVLYVGLTLIVMQ